MGLNTVVFTEYCTSYLPIPVAARYKARVCGHLLAGIVGSTPAGVMDVYLF